MSTFRDRVNAQRKQIAESRAQGEKGYKFPVGKTVFRILPGVVDADDFSKEYGAHYIKDPATDQIVAVVGDAEICYGRACPVRQAIGKLVQENSAIGDTETAKKFKDMLAKSSYVTNVEIIGGPDAANKGKVVRVEWSKTQYDAILSQIDTLFMANENFNMSEGLTLVVERVGTGQQDTRYTFGLLPGAIAPPTKEVLDQRVDLQTYVDSKFGSSVERALSKLSILAGEDITNTAAGQALASNVRTGAEQKAITSQVDTAYDPVAEALGNQGIIDAEYEPATQATSSSADDDVNAILAEVGAL